MCVCSGGSGKGKYGFVPQLGPPQPEFTSREKSLAGGNKSWRSDHIDNQSPKFTATWCFPPAGAGEHIWKAWSGVIRALCWFVEGRLWRCHLHTSQHLLYQIWVPGKVVLPLRTCCALVGLVCFNLVDTMHGLTVTECRSLFSLAARKLRDDCFPNIF